jgi:hypothetical protein
LIDLVDSYYLLEEAAVVEQSPHHYDLVEGVQPVATQAVEEAQTDHHQQVGEEQSRLRPVAAVEEEAGIGYC